MGCRGVGTSIILSTIKSVFLKISSNLTDNSKEKEEDRN